MKKFLKALLIMTLVAVLLPAIAVTIICLPWLAVPALILVGISIPGLLVGILVSRDKKKDPEKQKPEQATTKQH